MIYMGFPGGSEVILPTVRGPGLYPRLGEIPWEEGIAALELLSFSGESPWTEASGLTVFGVARNPDMTEQLSTAQHMI